MKFYIEPFGKMSDGAPVNLYTIENDKGARASISSYGAVLTSLIMPDRNGEMDDIVLGFDQVTPYTSFESGFMGAIVGRVANRISNANFVLDDKEYCLPVMDGRNCVHGGFSGFSSRLWMGSIQETGVQFQLFSEDNDQGFPGNLNVKVTYALSENNELIIDYEAVSDQKTICNLTNHSYFNLAGHGSGTIYNHILHINTNRMLELDSWMCPTGNFIDTRNLIYGFTDPLSIGIAFRDMEKYEELKNTGGLDFPYCFDDNGLEKHLAEIYEPLSGRYLEVISDLPCLQVYTSNGLKKQIGKSGAIYGPHSAICLEAQKYPDAIHYPNFSDIVLLPEKIYRNHVIYKFSTK